MGTTEMTLLASHIQGMRLANHKVAITITMDITTIITQIASISEATSLAFTKEATASITAQTNCHKATSASVAKSQAITSESAQKTAIRTTIHARKEAFRFSKYGRPLSTQTSSSRMHQSISVLFWNRRRSTRSNQSILQLTRPTNHHQRIYLQRKCHHLWNARFARC